MPGRPVCLDGTDLADAGANVVVGGHSHRVNGAGWLGSSYVAYGLGNFVWWRSREPDSRTGVLTLSVDVRAAQREGRRTNPVVTGADWTPSSSAPTAYPASPAEQTASAWPGVEQAAACSGLSQTP